MKKALLLLVLLSTVIGLSVSVRILSEPAGAAVYIDGEYRGNTPLMQNLLPGEYDLKLELRGFLTDEQKITVDQVTNLNTTLKIDSQWLGGQVLPVSIVQFISSGTPPRSTKEKRLAQEILQMNFEETNLKSRDAGLDDTETEALTERFSISSLEKLKAKNSDSRFALVGTLLRVENSDGSVRARMELWLYDLEKGSIITSYSAEESGTGREASRMAIERCVKTLVPKVTSRIIAELPDPQVTGGRKRVNLYDISYDKFPEIKIAFNIKDDSGAYESEISPSDIRLSEDGTEIVDFALKREYGEDSYLVMILDTSGSMENDIELLKSSAIEFIDNIPETTKISILVYGKTDPGGSVDVFPPSLVQPFTSDREALKREINSLSVHGLTPLYNSIFLASKFLEGVDGTRILVAFTDGYNHVRGETRTLEEVKAALRLVKPITYILGFSRLAAQKELKALAQSVNGTFSYIENPEKIKDIYESVSREIRSANIITYKTLGGKELTLTIARDYVATLVLPISRPPEPPEATEGIGEGFEKDIVLKWKTEKTGDKDVKYELLFGKSPETLVTLANDLTEGYFELIGLELSTTYYWAVIASGRHSSTPSNIFSFTTITPLVTGGTAREKIDSGRYEEVIEKILGGEVSIAEDEKAVLLARAMAKNLQEGGSERYLQPVMENLEKARLQFPRSPLIRAGMVELYLVMEEFEKARSELNEARRLGLEESWLVTLTARLNLATQGLRTARETLEEAVIAGDAETLKESAGIYLEIGDSDRALELVREAREKEPENVSIARKEIEILRQTDRKEALEVVEWALEIEPENESLLVSKVELLYETGQIEEALKFLEEVAGRIAPENIELLRLKAMILEELGNLEEAMEVLSRAIELSPEDVSLKNYYIMIGGEESERSALIEEDRKEVPEIKLLTPKLPYTDRSNVIIKVKVSDNVGIEEVRINGEREATYYGKGTMQLAKRLELEGGENEVKIEALDMAGNRTSLSFSVFRDTRWPVIEAPDEVVTRESTYTLIITVSDDLLVKSLIIGNREVEIGEKRKTLSETISVSGDIELTLKALDLVGNETTKNVRIRQDTKAPEISLEYPERVAPEIDRATVKVKVTDNYSLKSVTFSGREIGIETVELEVQLVSGTNVFEITAEDVAGNMSTKSITIEREREIRTVESYTPSGIVPSMVLVEKGSFTMGDTWGDGYDDEKPTHEVMLTYDFYIGKYETTFDEYDAFCEATGRSKPDNWGWGRANRPVINVSWWDAIAYCNWLSEKEKLPKAYDNNGNFLDKDGRVTTDPSKVVGYRLPTEAEWEYTARGGNKSKGYKYAGSDNVDDVAWYDSNSGDKYLTGDLDWDTIMENNCKTHEVGKKSPNELGVYDMSGNVWEWCSDGYDNNYYSKSPTTNPYNSTGGSFRIYRGGSWYGYVTGTRVAFRFNYDPEYAFGDMGFRVTRTVPSEGENRPYQSLTPCNPNPSDKATGQSLTVTLSWGSYPDGDTVTYDVYFDTNTKPTTKVSSNQVENTFNRSNLSYGTTYYWKVVAKDSKGATTEGPIWSFSTHIDLTLYKPSTVVPPVILVEKGSFTMGGTWGDGYDNEKPTHKVTFTYNFYIGKYETTFDEYDAFREATGRNKPYDEGWGRGTRPVIWVSWNNAVAYCNWLSEKENLPKAYDNNGNLLDKDGRITTDPSKVIGYRLPTEAEWEYAARGGSKSKGYKYSGSDNVDDVAWYRQNSGDKYLTGDLDWNTMMENNCRTHEVGKKAPNELGIYDMSGNVWEWCSGLYGDYSSSAQTNPYNSTAGSDRVYRGGGWSYNAADVRVADRHIYSPTGKNSVLGFRICRTVPYEGENRSPLSPSNPGPSDKATSQPTTITISWECSDPDGDTLTYDVYFGTSINPRLLPKVSTSQSGKTLNRSNLSYDTTYYWKVVAKDAKGATTEGPVWKFTTQSAPTASSYTPSGIVPSMVLVEKGSFTMGDTWGDGYSDDEQPTHKVTFTYDFYIGKYETTFDEYDAFCNATGRSKPEDEGWGRANRPVIYVSWWDAIAYCNWLSQKEGLPVAYRLKGEVNEGQLLDSSGDLTTDITKVVGYRLPTEAEWEYATRGGNRSEGYKYSGSDNVDDVAWYWRNSGDKYLTGDWDYETIMENNCRTQEVGKKAPNELGIYDMSGNVWEWCSDWYGSYSSSAQTNPYNSTAGSYRVIRGGCWNNAETYVRVAIRYRFSPTYAGYVIGFRICRTVPYEGKNRPPLAPYNPIPSDEAVVWATAITLGWDSYDPDDDTMTYDVYFDTNASPKTKVSSNQVENTFNRSNLSYGTTYYWKVVAKDSKGAATEGSVWRFTTQSAPKTPSYTPTSIVPPMVLVEKPKFPKSLTMKTL